MRRQPNRSSNSGMSVSERFHDGICRIFSVSDSAAPGYQPKIERTLKGTLNFRSMRLGIQRYYAAMQAQQRIDRVIRVPVPSFEISAQDEVWTSDGKMYGISLIQDADGVFPRSVDLTLTLLEQGGECP